MNSKTHSISLQKSKTVGALASLLLLAACSSSSDDNDSQDVGSVNLGADATTLIIDASDYEEYAYLNLDTGGLIELNEEQATTSTDWHIAFRRASIKLNGGTSGAGNTAGALSAPQDDFYDAEGEPDTNVFLNATMEMEEEHLDPSIDISSLDFITDAFSAAIQGSEETTGTEIDMGWYTYNFVTHQTTLNSDTWWLLRSNLGTSYGKFHATAFSYDRIEGLDVTFEFDVQAEGTDQFAMTATFLAHVDAAGGEDCFDFDANTSVNCDDDSWDIKLEIDGRNWTLWTNSGVSGDGAGGAFGPFSTEDADEYTAGHLSPEGVDITSHYTSDTSAGIFNENSWYAYNLEERHKLWPNFRTFAIDTDTTNPEAKKYQLQVVNYYSDTGTSGHPNIRFIEIINE